MKNLVNDVPLDGSNAVPAAHMPKELAQDARTGALRALRQFLGAIVFHRKGSLNPATGERGEPISFKVPKQNIHVEWPDDEVRRRFPSIALIASGQGTYQLPGMGPRITHTDEFEGACGANTYVRNGTLVEDITIELWAATKAERACLRSGIEHIMNPSEDYVGIRLRVPEHHNAIASFLITGASNIDEEDGIRNRRRALITAALRMPILVPVKKPMLITSIGVFVETGEVDRAVEIVTPTAPVELIPPVVVSVGAFTTLGGTNIPVTGTGFAPDISFSSPGFSITTTYVDSTNATIDVAAHAAGTFDLLATQASGTSEASGNGKLVVLALPVITSATSVSASGGTSYVLGSDFTPDVVLSSSFGLGTTTFVDSAHLMVVIPPHAAGTFDLTATQTSGTGTLVGALTVLALPTIASISAVSASGGVSTITGANWIAGDTINVDGVDRLTLSGSASPVNVTVPAHAAGTVNVVVKRGAYTSPPVSMTYAAAAANPSTFSASGYWEQRNDNSDYTDADGNWEDRSGNSRNWVQATSGNRPPLGTAVDGAAPIVIANVGKGLQLPYGWGTMMGAGSAFGLTLLVKFHGSYAAYNTPTQTPQLLSTPDGYWNMHAGTEGGVLYVGFEYYDNTAYRRVRAAVTPQTWLQVTVRLVGGVLAIEVNAAPVNVDTGTGLDKNVAGAACGATASQPIQHQGGISEAPATWLAAFAKGGITDADVNGCRAWWRQQYPSLAGVLPP